MELPDCIRWELAGYTSTEMDIGETVATCLEIALRNNNPLILDAVERIIPKIQAALGDMRELMPKETE